MSFRTKLALCMVWLLTLAYGVGGMLLILQSFENGLSQERQAAAASYEMTCRTIQLVNLVDLRRDFSGIGTTLGRMNSAGNQRALRLLRQGQTAYASGDTFCAIEPETGCVMAQFSERGAHLLQISGVLHANGEPLQLDIVYDVSAIYRTRAEQLTSFRRIFLVLLALGGGASWLTAALLTRPLARVSSAARRLSEGELDARANVRTRDELGQLGADFDRMADALAQSIEDLRTSMERQEQFMGSFAHELKTPMTSIIGYADLLRGQRLTPEEQNEAANYIFSEGKRLEALSWKLLDLLMMKHQSLTLVPTEMSRLIGALVTHLQPIYREKGIRLQCRCQSCVCRVEPDLIRSVLTNLIDNARKAMDEGGNIYLLAERSGGIYRIAVLDNGRGMPREAIERLTEAFYRVDKARSRAQGGAGLGLTLCRRILDLHGGSMSFESREGNGTCVTVRLKEAEP